MPRAGPEKAAGSFWSHGFSHQLRQLGDVGDDAPGLVAGEEVRGRMCCDATLLKFNFAAWEQIVQRRL
jgi:hypothetical protein